MVRKRKLLLITLSSLLQQVLNIVCGLVIPRSILIHYGSVVNGVVDSVNQFISVITMLECGINSVIQSNLYYPLVKGDIQSVSEIFILSISLSFLAQYFFGLPYRILLNADQCGYIWIFLQCIAIILNTLISLVLMKLEITKSYLWKIISLA